MIPPLIIQTALEKGIQILAITDHNATGNIQAVQEAAAGRDIHVFPGMELQTAEEIHALCLFDTLEQTQEFQKLVNQNLPNLKNSPEHFGVQVLVDHQGELIGEDSRLLIASTSLSLDSALKSVNAMGGLLIPAHVNRNAYGLIATLGFIPEALHLAALEISSHITPVEAGLRFPQIKGYPLIHSGDAHRLDEILGLNQFFIETPTISEIYKAFQGVEGRILTLL